MKRKTFMPCFVLLLVLFTLHISGALANSYGLSNGALLQFVDGNKDYADYSAYITTKQKKSDNVAAALMTYKDSAVLLAAHKNSNGTWEYAECFTVDPIYFGKNFFTFATDTDTLILQNKNSGDHIVFRWLTEEENDLPDGLYLTGAAVYGNELVLGEDNRYHCNDQLTWFTATPMAMQDFNIQKCMELMHDPEQTIRTMNTLYVALESHFASNEPVSLKQKVQLPVYSAPSTDSYRAAKGKASVSLKEEVTPMAKLDTWTMVEYAVKFGTHRIGWVESDLFDDVWTSGYLELSCAVPVTLDEDYSYITDDPNGRQSRTISVSPLQQVQALCVQYPIPWYTYVTAKTEEGQDIWGFVPTMYVIPEENLLTATLVGETLQDCEVFTDDITYLETIPMDIFNPTGYQRDASGTITAITGYYGTIVERDCYAPLNSGVRFTYRLAEDYTVLGTDGNDDLTVNVSYPDIASFLPVLYGEGAGEDDTFACTLVLNDAGEVAQITYYYVPWG